MGRKKKPKNRKRKKQGLLGISIQKTYCCRYGQLWNCMGLDDSRLDIHIELMRIFTWWNTVTRFLHRFLMTFGRGLEIVVRASDQKIVRSFMNFKYAKQSSLWNGSLEVAARKSNGSKRRKRKNVAPTMLSRYRGLPTASLPAL